MAAECHLYQYAFVLYTSMAVALSDIYTQPTPTIDNNVYTVIYTVLIVLDANTLASAGEDRGEQQRVQKTKQEGCNNANKGTERGRKL